MFETEERMKKAIVAVKAKQFRSVEAAAEHFDVPPSTLGHRLSERETSKDQNSDPNCPKLETIATETP
jgi:hypothetical protein